MFEWWPNLLLCTCLLTSPGDVMWCYVLIYSSAPTNIFWSCQSQPSTATNFSMGHRDVVAEGRMSRLLQHLEPQLPYKRSTASLSNIGKRVDAINGHWIPRVLCSGKGMRSSVDQFWGCGIRFDLQSWSCYHRYLMIMCRVLCPCDVKK